MMLLAIDIGNTEITMGVFLGDRLGASWRATTTVSRTPDEWASMLTSLLTNAGHSTDEVRAAVGASVAPSVTEALADGVALATGQKLVTVGPSSPLPIVLDVEEPLTVGADRVVNTLAAAELYGRDTIVVDFGTATTFDCITGDGHFLGGVIAPGLQAAADNLSRLAAKLPSTELRPPDHIIGRRTEDCIRAGVLFGTAELVDGIVRRIKSEWPGGNTPLVVATGGLVLKVADLCSEVEQVEPHLTLLGLRLAAQHLGIKW